MGILLFLTADRYIHPRSDEEVPGTNMFVMIAMFCIFSIFHQLGQIAYRIRNNWEIRYGKVDQLEKEVKVLKSARVISAAGAEASQATLSRKDCPDGRQQGQPESPSRS